MKNLSTCLWFDSQAEEAVKFYSTVFENCKVGAISRYGESGAKVSGQKAGTVLTVQLQIENLEIEALNGGPLFKFNPSLSYFVNCISEKEINDKWTKLSAGGQVRMGLDKYPWAEKYGWTTDKFGVEWQLILAPHLQKVRPAFLFVDDLFGKGEEAVNYYLSLFPNSKIETIVRDEATKSIMHCAFILNGQGFVLMEGQGKHGHSFNESSSLVVNCDTQAEIDQYWDKLSAGGSIQECGWVKDRFGVSWQIVPAMLRKLIADPSKSEKVMKTMLQMKKLEIAPLEQAAK